MARRIGRALTEIEGVERGIPLLREPERIPELAPTQTVTVGSEDTFNAAIKDPNALTSLREAVAAGNEPAKQEAIRVFETTNKERSFKDLLDVKKTAEGALDFATSPTGKFIGRVGIETGLGLTAAGPIGGATALTRSVGRNFVLRSGERVARGLVRAAPNMARVGVGEAVGSLISEGFDPTLDPESGEFSLPLALERAAETGAYGALFESFVPGVNDAIEFLRKGGFRLVDDAAEPVVEKILEEGAAAAPGFFANSRTLQVLDNIAAGSFIGGGKGRKAKRKGAEVFNEEVESFIDAYRTAAKSSIEVESLARNLIEGGVENFNLVGKKMYGVIDEIGDAGFVVDLNPLINQLNKMANEFKGEGAEAILKKIDRIRKRGQVSDLNTVTFETAADIRSSLLSITRDGTSLFGDAASAFGKRTSPIVHEAMEKAFKMVGDKPGLIEEIPGELLARKLAADKFWKDGAKIFNTDLMAQLAGDAPTGLVRAAQGSPGAMKIMRETIEGIDTPVRTAAGEILTGKQVWDQVKGQLLFEESRKVLGKTTGEVTEGIVQGQQMVNQLLAKPELMTEAFGKEGYESVLALFERAAFAQGKGAKKGLPGRIWIQFAQATALATPLTIAMGVGDPALQAAGAAFVLTGPAMIAGLFASPRFTRLILKGTDKNIAFAKRTRALVQAAAMAQREGYLVAGAADRSKKDIPFGVDRPIPAFPAHLAGPRNPQ